MLRPVLSLVPRNALVMLSVLLFASGAFAGTYTIKSGDNPASIAKKAGISVNDLMKANPGLDPRKLHVGQELNVPGGAQDKAKKEEPKKSSSKKTETAPAATKSPSSTAGSYTVKSGDTPGKIASSQGISTKELMRANPDLDPAKLKVGQKLVIPGKGEGKSEAEEAPNAREEETAAKKKVMEKAEKLAAEQAGQTGQAEKKKTAATAYKVQKGDSLGKIASKFKISLNELRKANGNLDPRKLRVGQTLNIPGQAAEEEAAAPAPAETPEPSKEPESAVAPPPSAPSGEPAKPEAEAPKEQAKGKTPVDADAYFERGNELGKQNKFQQAIESFDKAIKINPDRADYYASRGHAFYYMKLYSRAIEDYSRAIERNAKFALAYSMRGLSRTRNNQFEQAVTDYDKAIELSPKEADYYKGRGWTYFHLKQYEPMCADYNKACDLGDCEFLEVAKKSNLCTAGQ